MAAKISFTIFALLPVIISGLFFCVDQGAGLGALPLLILSLVLGIGLSLIMTVVGIFLVLRRKRNNEKFGYHLLLTLIAAIPILVLVPNLF